MLGEINQHPVAVVVVVGQCVCLHLLRLTNVQCNMCVEAKRQYFRDTSSWLSSHDALLSPLHWLPATTNRLLHSTSYSKSGICKWWNGESERQLDAKLVNNNAPAAAAAVGLHEWGSELENMKIAVYLYVGPRAPNRGLTLYTNFLLQQWIQYQNKKCNNKQKWEEWFGKENSFQSRTQLKSRLSLSLLSTRNRIQGASLLLLLLSFWKLW